MVEDDEVDVMNVKEHSQKNNIKNDLLLQEMALRLWICCVTRSFLLRIIILDINMPKMNGIEFLKELRVDESLKKSPFCDDYFKRG
jgi:CheY-like chemotaxis protein